MIYQIASCVDMKSYPAWYEQQWPGNIVVEQLAERIWYTKFQSSLLNIFFHLGGFQSLLPLIHFPYPYGPNTCSQCTKMWHGTYPIQEATHSKLACGGVAWHSFALLRKSGTEALSGRVLCYCKSYPVHCEHGLNSISLQHATDYIL